VDCGAGTEGGAGADCDVGAPFLSQGFGGETISGAVCGECVVTLEPLRLLPYVFSAIQVRKIRKIIYIYIIV
jgi:hypothetical protein